MREQRQGEGGSPWALSRADKIAVVKRAWAEASDDNIGIVAAGVAFYGFLAIVPLLGALVLSYGIFADPHDVVDTMTRLTAVMPADAARLVGEQLMTVVEGSDGKKGFGLLLALGIALFGARNGAGAIVTALNIAYEEHEKRGIVVLNLTALAITAAAVVVALVAVVAVAALGALDTLLAGQPLLVIGGRILSYLVFLVVSATAAAALYRFGPSRTHPRWRWITPGSLFTAIGWLLLTLGFGVYVARFGNYNATYGSLGAVVVLLTWLYLSSYLLLFGAELNGEFEHQVAHDTTTGAARAMGARGAWVADHVAGPAPAAPAPPPARGHGATIASGIGAATMIVLGQRRAALVLLAVTMRRALASPSEADTQAAKPEERT